MAKTKSGFEVELSKDRLNNYELVEALGEFEENPIALTKVLKLLLGKEDINRLKEHLRNDEGIVPLDKLEKEIAEMFQSQPDTKNS